MFHDKSFFLHSTKGQSKTFSKNKELEAGLARVTQSHYKIVQLLCTESAHCVTCVQLQCNFCAQCVIECLFCATLVLHTLSKLCTKVAPYYTQVALYCTRFTHCAIECRVCHISVKKSAQKFHTKFFSALKLH